MYPSLSQPINYSQQLKKGKCYKCQNQLQIPISECLAQCTQCNRINLFICHIIKKQVNMTSNVFTTLSKQKIQCKQCKNNYAIFCCSRCKGFCAIRDFISGVGYQCVCGWKGVYLGCGGCGEVLALPPGKDFQKVVIKCKSCNYQFSYKICNSCRKCIYKQSSDKSPIYLCTTPTCPQSGTGQQNTFTNTNPYYFLPQPQPQTQQINEQLKYRITQFEQQIKNQKQTQQKFKDMCKVCLNNQAIMINTSCYHLALCQKCAGDVQGKLNGRCPVCRVEGKYQRVFRS